MSNRAYMHPPAPVHPRDAVCVALALDGYDVHPRAIHLLRFQSSTVLDRLSIPISPAGRVTGSKPHAQVMGFVGAAPLVGYALSDLWAALAWEAPPVAGLAWDLRELATLLLPGAPGESVSELAGRLLGDGAASGTPADQVRRVYLALMDRAEELGSEVILRLASYTIGHPSGIAGLLSSLARPGAPSSGSIDATGHRALAERLERPRPIGQPRKPQAVSPGEVEALLSAKGVLARQFPRFDPRPQQVAMARAVAEALDPGEGDGHGLMVEGGTGLGKSLAYLLPAILFAVRNNQRVMVSTDTINLQEQLVHKDIPQLLAALSSVPELDLASFRYAQMKGKGNYLCLRRWDRLAASPSLTIDEADTVSKTLVWLQRTRSGDRAELDLRGRELAVWDRISATNFRSCPGAREGGCFYRYAREQAAAAHLVVVNHALLLSDLLVGGTLLPEYDHLIVDEAHNLEEEATRQFGFQVSQSTVEELAEQLSGIFQSMNAALGVASLDAAYKEAVQRRIEEARDPLARVRDRWAVVVASLLAFVAAQRAAEGGVEEGLRITQASRAQPAWSEMEIVWDNFDRALAETGRQVSGLLHSLEQAPADRLPGQEELSMELGEWLQRQGEARQRISGLVAHPEESMVYWVSQNAAAGQGRSAIVLNGAPLDVAGRLQRELFSRKRSVVVTSATLVVRDEFTHLRKRLGLEEVGELRLDSPFDYRRAALLCLPSDLPEPNAPGYLEAVVSAIGDLAEAANGHTMVLFTSHAMLRAAAQALRAKSVARGAQVLAQGVDGTPQQLLVRFQQRPCAVLLGTSSFWEGVDIGNSALKVLVLARLPFNVPTDPVFSARSELYADPFVEYAVPQAVLRFRQGFGRLIRSSGDRGAVAVLDRRIRSRAYGRWFLESVPPATTFQGSMRQVVAEVRDWLAYQGP